MSTQTLSPPELETLELEIDGDIGVLIVFRTSEFSEAEPVTSLAAESELNAAGSWGVTAK